MKFKFTLRTLLAVLVLCLGCAPAPPSMPSIYHVRAYADGTLVGDWESCGTVKMHYGGLCEFQDLKTGQLIYLKDMKVMAERHEVKR